MASDRPAPTKKARATRPNKESPGGSPKSAQKTSRAQRDDTPEARRQRSGVSKTHPTRNTPQARKDSLAKHPKR
jgi:hypothetical protein